MAKKSFKDANPAMQFISVEEANEATRVQEDAAQRDVAPKPPQDKKDERKSKRLNLLVKPGTLESITKVAHMKRVSVNHLINVALEAYAKENAELIERYDGVFGAEE